jgi:hypothetical protein
MIKLIIVITIFSIHGVVLSQQEVLFEDQASCDKAQAYYSSSAFANKLLTRSINIPPVISVDAVCWKEKQPEEKRKHGPKLTGDGE